MSRIKQGVQTILNGVVANGIGTVLDVGNYKAVVVQIATSGSTTATIKFAISMSKTKPDFTTSPSASNQYDYVQLNWLNNDSSNPGSTGILIAGTDIVKIFELNTDYVRWLCPIVSGYSAGTITCICDAVNDFTRN